MPLYLTASHSSRIRKPGSGKSPLRRSSSSPFSNLSRSKPSQHTKSADKGNVVSSDGQDEKLDDTGTVISLAAISPVSSVIQAIKHSHGSIFCDIPERAGMNSTRIAEVLNFRRGLPPIMSMAHVHGLITASTRTEREIASLLAAGDIRNLTVSGRGNEISGLGEFLVLTQDLESRIRGSSLNSDVGGMYYFLHLLFLPDAFSDNFIELLRQHPRSTSLSANLFAPSEVTALRNAGFLVSSGISRKPSVATAAGTRLAPPNISRQASGTAAAAGGEAAFDSLGGIGSARTSSLESVTAPPGTELTPSLPNTGVYLRLLNDARTHLLELLGKSKYREAPLYLLRERWDGAIESDNKVSNAKRIRGEFAGVLPGKTKKWKQLYGLDFDWVLEECLGAGLVELFETGSVGHGIRVV
jgi:Serine-threonine protein kinase 19